MVLEQLKDGAQRQLQVFNDEGVKQLVFILCLPLVDGVFATLLVTGAVETFTDIVAVALTVFSGAGALAVLYSHSNTQAEAKSIVLRAAPFLVAGAALIASVAPIYEQLFYTQRLQYAAGLALLVISGKLAEVDLADKFSVPAIILTGLVLSIKSPSGIHFSMAYMLPALMTSLTAVLALYASSYLTGRNLTMSYIQKGSAVVLVLISLSMFGVSVPSELGLAVFAASVAASLG
jgi:hypothetical protein